MNNKNTTLQLLTARLLSDWAMLLVEPLTDLEEVYQSETLRCATVRFSNAETNGSVYLIFDEKLAAAVVENVLGVADQNVEINALERSDAMLELVNILGNYVASDIFAIDQRMALSLPEYCPVPNEARLLATAPSDEQKLFTAVRADGSPLLAYCEVKEVH